MAVNLKFLILAAENEAKKGEQAFAAGLPAATRCFKNAADNYRKAAEADPSKKQQYLALADTYEQKAGQTPPPAPQQGNNTGRAGGPAGGPPTVNRGTETQAQATTQTQTAGASSKEPMSVDEAMEKLNSLVGLTGVKEQVQSLVSQARLFQARRERGLPIPEGFSYHLVFTGNPGTGKTTVARLMGQIYKGLGILAEGQLIETQRSDLVAGYVGQTATKTREVIQSAMGGVLFVDEVYTLNKKDSGNDFGQEAIDELLKAMEDHRDELIVVVAGYSDLMVDFLNSNPGLQSRFNTVIEFEDYCGEEMQKIFDSICRKNQFTLTPGAASMLRKYFDSLYAARDKNFGNGRTVRNVFQKLVAIQSARLSSASLTSISDEELTTFTEADIRMIVSGKGTTSSPEYERIKKAQSNEKIKECAARGDFGAAAIAFCTRLEGMLKHMFHFNGDLCEMINELKADPSEKVRGLGRAAFDCLHRMRTYRNAYVHSGSTDVELTVQDIAEALRIITALE